MDKCGAVEERFTVAMSLAGLSDAAYGAQQAEGRCRLGYVIGFMYPTLNGPRRILQWVAKFARQLAASSLGDEVYAFCEMVDHMSLLREFKGRLANFSPGMLGPDDCECLPKNLKRKNAITAKYRGIQLSLEMGTWTRRTGGRGLENPA